MASFSVGILVGPAVGSMLSALTATWVACSCGLLTVAYVYFLVPESLSQAAMLEVRRVPQQCRIHENKILIKTLWAADRRLRLLPGAQVALAGGHA